MNMASAERSPGSKLGLAILVGILLSIPLFAVWMLVYDRQHQSETAQSSIAEGWGGPQRIAGPLLGRSPAIASGRYRPRLGGDFR